MERLTGKEKHERDKAICDFSKRYPYYTQQNLADHFQVSQRIVASALKERVSK